MCYAPANAGVQWTVPVVAAGKPIDGIGDSLFATIKFGTGEKLSTSTRTPAVAVTSPSERRAGPSGPANADAAKLDAFAIQGTTFGYQGSSDFLTFIRNAE